MNNDKMLNCYPEFATQDLPIVKCVGNPWPYKGCYFEIHPSSPD
jgi:hypothetical protein